MAETWTTDDEIEHIQNLGKHIWTGRSNMKVFATSRLKLLERYKKAALKRYKWDDINKDEVMIFINNEIDFEKVKKT